MASSAAGAAPPPLVTLARVGRRVALVTLNDPARRNAMTLPLARAFGRVADELVRDGGRTFGCVVVAGRGAAFSAGGDLAWLRDRTRDPRPARNADAMHAFYRLFLRVRDLPVPVIACLNGHAIGAGLCFAMACDIRVASVSAKLGFTFVGLGLHPGMGATHLVASVAGYETAFRMLLTGDIVTGEDARALRLVSHVAESGEAALAHALALAGRVAAQAPAAVRATVRTLRRAQDGAAATLEQALRREADAQAHGYAGPDCREGIEAVAGKRAPQWVEYDHAAKL